MTRTASIIVDFWDDQLVAHGRQYLFLVLLGLVGSFLVIRVSTRLQRSPRVPWWPGSIVSDGGLHVHHMVFGIATMMAAGVLSFALTDVGFWYEASALLFGIGMGLTIDEFALWLYVSDVYWAKEGRRSIDATIIAVAVMGLLLLGSVPFEVFSNSGGDLVASLVLLGLLVWVVGVCFLKTRIFTAPSGSSSSRSPSTVRAGSASRTRPGASAATASAGPRSRRRPSAASGPTASPSG